MKTKEEVDVMINGTEIQFLCRYEDIDCGFIALHNAFFEVIKKHYFETVAGAKTLSEAIARIQKTRGILNTGKTFSDRMDKKEMN